MIWSLQLWTHTTKILIAFQMKCKYIKMTYPMQQHSSTMLPIIKGMKCMECYTLLYSKTFSCISCNALQHIHYFVMYIQHHLMYMLSCIFKIFFIYFISGDRHSICTRVQILYSFSRYNIYADFLVALDPPF